MEAVPEKLTRLEQRVEVLERQVAASAGQARRGRRVRLVLYLLVVVAYGAYLLQVTGQL